MSDLVMFLRGRVATSDGTKLPHDTLVERLCNNNVRQQVYTAPDGSFSMQLGSRTNVTLDASADGNWLLYLAGRALYVSHHGQTPSELTSGLIAAVWA